MEVTESHTYSFDGKFNGITRELVPKEGAKNSQVTGTENGQTLKVEKEDNFIQNPPKKGRWIHHHRHILHD